MRIKLGNDTTGFCNRHDVCGIRDKSCFGYRTIDEIGDSREEQILSRG